jgi:NTP pyrophosphatase (non-canonical NTP hydrolase)
VELKGIQREVDDWIRQYKLGYFKPLEILARLTEETGELAREINHKFGPKKKKLSENENDIGGEIADIVFTLTCLANSLGLDMNRDCKRMMKKYDTRDKNRWEKTSKQ